MVSFSSRCLWYGSLGWVAPGAMADVGAQVRAAVGGRGPGQGGAVQEDPQTGDHHSTPGTLPRTLNLITAFSTFVSHTFK